MRNLFSKSMLKLISLLFFSTTICDIKNRYSETFLFTRPCYQRLAMYESLWENMTYDHYQPRGSMQAIGIYQKSVPDYKKAKQYFLMEDFDSLSVKGDDVNKFDRNIRAEWLQLPANFDGSFTLDQEQEQLGALFVVRKDLKTWCDWDIFDKFWLGASLPIVMTKNELNLSQSYKETATTFPHTIIEALNRPEIIYNKMKQCSETFGFTELRLLIGARFETKNKIDIATRTGFLIPFGNKYNGCQFFEAIRGFNQHFGFETTLNTQFPLNCSDSCKILFFADFTSLFLFDNKQYRTFDLYNKPYSRYLLLNSTTGETNIPAINVLTVHTKIKPHNYGEISTGLRFKRKNIEAQIGYGFWGYGSEKAELYKPFSPKYGIAATPGAETPQGLPATASRSTIKTLAPTDTDDDGNNIFIPITAEDLDLWSGVARGSFTNNIELSIGLVHEGPVVCGFAGFGGFVEIPMNNAALMEWGVWFKVGGKI